LDITRFFTAWQADRNEWAAVTLENTFQIPGAKLSSAQKTIVTLSLEFHPLTHKTLSYYGFFLRSSTLTTSVEMIL
jgi:hypothetical protein